MNQKPTTPRLRLRVTATAESIVRSGHPWLFADSIREQNRDGTSGELAVIYDRKNEFLAVGLYDPESPIRVRMLHSGKPATLDANWWRERLRQAVARRESVFDSQTNGGRLIHGESDGWPGLVLDRYDDVLVLKLYTTAWLPRLAEINQLLGNELNPKRLVIRLSRNIQDTARQRFSIQEGQEMLPGPEAVPPASRVQFLETGLHFEADVVQGQKTGFFLDQRENRRRVGTLAEGRDVLNAFSFSGAFSLYAARGKARSVTDLDISGHALSNAERNFALNKSLAAVAACPHKMVQADAFEWLAGSTTGSFDLIVIDPPSLARRESERATAIQAYERLAGNGVRALRHGGILVAASCSAHVSASEFFDSVRRATRNSGRRFVELETSGHPLDHPATFPEAQYLKCIYLRER
jgi:23S rRNA (cytosine1962-C5)-methyltransferase